MAEENEARESAPVKVPPKPILVNGVPISHMADGSDLDKIQALIDRETTPAVSPAENPDAVARPAPVRKEKPNPARKPPEQRQQVAVPPPANVDEQPSESSQASREPVRKVSGKAAFAAFKQALGSATIPVKLYSEDREITLRELTVTDQKSLSKTAMINNSRRDIVYNSQCAMINSCVKTKNFSIQEYTEFDRIVLLLRLYEQNYFKNDIKYVCPKCQKENVYQLDFSKILDRIRAAWRPDKQYLISHGDKNFRFTVGWPKVSTVSEFYNNYYRQYNSANENTRNTIDQLSNVEYLVMFIKGIDLILGENDEISLDLNDSSYAERSDIIDSLPQGVIFDDEDGIITKVVADFTDPLNKSFQYEKCAFCGAETEEGIGSIADFT